MSTEDKKDKVFLLIIGLGNFKCNHFGCNLRSDYGINKIGSFQYEKTYCQDHLPEKYKKR